MAYQNLTLRNIAGEVTATYNDGTFRSLTPPDPRSGNTAAFIGTAASGVSHEFFEHVDRSLTFREFGADSEIAAMVQSAKVSDEQLPVIVSRIGAKPFIISLDVPVGNSANEKEALFSISPLFVQEKDAARNRKSTFESIKAIFLPYVEGGLVKQRLLLGIENNAGVVTPVYDSERKIVSSGESLFNVELNNPVGKVLLSNDGIKTADKINLGDVDDSFAWNVHDSSSQNVAQRLSMLESMNDLVEFDWGNAKTLEAIDAGYLVMLSPYELDGEDSVLTLGEIGATYNRISGKSNKEIRNLSKRYVGVELAYRGLEYENVGYIYCEGCYADTECADLDSMQEESTNLQNLLTWPSRKLGNLWKFNLNGQEYSYMFGRKDAFNVDNVVSTYGRSFTNENVTFDFSHQKELGDILNLVEIHIHSGNDDSNVDVETFANKRGMIECHVTVASNIAAQVEVKTEFCNVIIPSAALLAEADGSVTRLRASSINGTETLSIYFRTGGDVKNAEGDWSIDDPFVMTHYDLTGQIVPEAVVNRIVKFSDSTPDQTTNHVAEKVILKEEIREISFLHQAAQAAYKASTNYSQTIAVVPTSKPSSSNDGLANWAGQAPTYEVNSQGELKVVADGTGLLGNKLLAGKQGYRDDAAFGGIVLTNGNDLPNEIPYGIDDNDEALDAFGQPIDLGKHVVVVGAYGLVADPASVLQQNNSAQRNPIFVNAGPKICAMLNALPPGNEPIGQVNGVVRGMIPRHRTSMSVLNDLALMRVCMIDQNSVISSIYSAAHPNSDYRKVSSILSANAILGRLRSLCMPYIGRPFKDEQIASLSQTIDGVMKRMVQDDYAQRIDVSLSASRLDRINGVLRASVRFVPPLSIEAITVEITLEPPAAGL